MNRRTHLDGNGALAALMVAPREFCYTHCVPCNRNLYYTEKGEACPFCGTIVEIFVAGDIPNKASLTALGMDGRRKVRRVIFHFDESSLEPVERLKAQGRDGTNALRCFPRSF
jgi:hypothetical protein